MVQNGGSEAVSMKMLVFLCCLTLSGWSDCIGVLYSSVRVDNSLRNCGNALVKRQISQKSIFAAHAKLFFIFFFFSKPNGLMNDVGKLLWALMSYIVFVLVHLYLRLSENVLPCEFHWHWRFLYIARRHFIVYDSCPLNSVFYMLRGYVMAAQPDLLTSCSSCSAVVH